MSELREVRLGENWIAKEIKRGLWKVFLADKSLLMTGAAVTVDLPVKFFHTLERIEVTQNDTSNVLNADSFDISFYKKILSDQQVYHSRATIWSKTGLLYSDYGINYTKDNFEREPATYTLSITGTNTNLFYPIIYLEGQP